MSRNFSERPEADGHAADSAVPAATNEAAKEAARAAEYIGLRALALAKCANAAGLTTLSYLLESAALEAGALAVERRCPDDAGQA